MQEPTVPLVRRLAAAAREQPVALGRYDVVGLLGQGGMGTVYDAIDRDRGTSVALKTLTVDQADGIRRLKREFRTVADVNHRNLAAVYELGCEEDLWFFTMQRIDGVDFRRWIRGKDFVIENPQTTLPVARTLDLPTGVQGTLTREWSYDGPAPDPTPSTEPSLPSRSFDDIRQALKELIRGIVALHDAGLRHGDIKPSNVLVDTEGRVVLVDFGLAQPLEGDREVSGGTPAYMSPEQLGGAYGALAWDWYAVGIMLYEALTGVRPFAGGSVLDLYLRKLNEVPRAPREVLTEIPEDLSEICMSLIRPQPSQRPDGHQLLKIFAGDEEARRHLAERSLQSEFVGREYELRLLEHAYSLARGGRCVVAHVHGPSGIGKSATVANFLGGIRQIDGARVFTSRCYERETLPYKAFDGIIDQLATWLQELESADLERVLPDWIAELAQLFPVLETVHEVLVRVKTTVLPTEVIELRRRALIALAKLLVQASQSRPVVLYVDDLQWADTDSIAMLVSILQGATDAKLLLVLGFRSIEAAENPAFGPYFEMGEQLEASGSVVDIAIDLLSQSEAELLARKVLGGTEERDDRVRALAREAGGMPFFIEELARFSATHPEARFEDLSLEDVIGERVRGLPPEQRTLMEIVAVSDRPISQSILRDAADLEVEVMPALLALRSACLISLTGAGADDPVAMHHDRIRESVIGTLDADTLADHHLAIGRLLAWRHREDRSGPHVFDVARHLNAAVGGLTPDERLEAAHWNLAAGRRAIESAAFPLASRCFEAGIRLLRDDAWDADYDLALGLQTGAAETAYLCGDWALMQARIEGVKANGRTVLDQLVAWEVEIDSLVGRQDYAGAVKTATRACGLLGVAIPDEPTEADVGGAIHGAMAALASLGPTGLDSLEDVSDPITGAAMRIQIRVAPAAFFAAPMLLPILACNLVKTSVDVGLSSATPYALAIYGVVLNTLGMQPVAHEWGQVALGLIDRWDDRKLEACTRYAVGSLVCNFMVPLDTTLDDLRDVFAIGKRTGDLEYGAYAAHAYVHNAIYASRPLGPLMDEALALGEEMRGLGQVNAMHVHEPFEQLLRSFTGKAADPAQLEGPSFNAGDAYAQAEIMGSRSGMFLIQYLIGAALFYFGDVVDASRELEKARQFTDASASTWHVPMFHQCAALAGCGAMDRTPEAERPELLARVEASLDELRKLAAHGPANFAHRVAYIEAELQRVQGDLTGAVAGLQRGIDLAKQGGWLNDVALGHELVARCHPDADRARDHLVQAVEVYAAWGAAGKVKQLEAGR